MAFDLIGDRVATATRQIARVWERNGVLVGSYEGHQGLVASALFGPPGLLITADESTVRLWDLATQQTVETLLHPESLGSGDIDISSDHTVLASQSGSRVYIWELAPPVSSGRAREIVDTLPLALEAGTLVRKPPPLSQPQRP